jgi:hypothetical protein
MWHMETAAQDSRVLCWLGQLEVPCLLGPTGLCLDCRGTTQPSPATSVSAKMVQRVAV